MKNRGYGPRGGQMVRKELEYHGLDGVPQYNYDGEPVKATGDELSIIILVYLMYMTGAQPERAGTGKTPEAHPRRVEQVAQRGRLYGARDGRDLCHDARRSAGARGCAGQARRVDINLPKASDCGGDRMIVDTANFIAIMEAAMEGECKLCFKQGGECKRCKLFKALSVEAAPKTWETTSGCVYRDIAMEGVGNMTEETKI